MQIIASLFVVFEKYIGNCYNLQFLNRQLKFKLKIKATRPTRTTQTTFPFRYNSANLVWLCCVEVLSTRPGPLTVYTKWHFKMSNQTATMSRSLMNSIKRRLLLLRYFPTKHLVKWASLRSDAKLYKDSCAKVLQCPAGVWWHWRAQDTTNNHNGCQVVCGLCFVKTFSHRPAETIAHKVFQKHWTFWEKKKNKW